jgi:hydroxyquinol 1,2-dioxygenase
MSTSFTPSDHLAQVLAAYSHSDDPRANELAQAAIRHLHAFVEEVGLTREEWFTGISWLVATGQRSDAVRNEFILASDTLGVSMLVEMINHRAAAGTTEPTVFGPFHVAGAPERERGASIADDDYGAPPLRFTGVVRSSTGTPLAGARLDVWQAAPNRSYDVQDPDMAPMNYRGVFRTAGDGSYEFATTRPPAYQIPGDGPAGAMLRAMNRHNWRPGHTHMVVEAEGHKTVITHVFDAGSDYLDSDAVFGVRESLIVDMTGPEVRFDVILEPN